MSRRKKAAEPVEREFLVTLGRVTYSSAEVIVTATSEDAAREKALQGLWDCVDISAASLVDWDVDDVEEN